MVLLVDDQAMVCEAIRRSLTIDADMDFHYCADPNQAVALAKQIKPTTSSCRTWSCPVLTG